MGLPAFEGCDVVSAAVAITKSGDGLSDALSIEPVALHHGGRVFSVLEGLVTQVNHTPLSPAAPDRLIRKHTVVTQRITPVLEADVKAWLDEAADRVQRAKEQAEGIQRLGDEEPSEPDDDRA